VEERLMRRRVAEARVGRLASVTADGWPHVVPCCFALRGDLLFSAVDDAKPKSTRSLRRLQNIRLHPEVSVLVDHYAEDWAELWWIRLDGRGRVEDPGSIEAVAGRELLAAKYEQYRRRPPPGPVILVEIDGWRAWP
jgi:PPOX class probable F420-dependent enzyme